VRILLPRDEAGLTLGTTMRRSTPGKVGHFDRRVLHVSAKEAKAADDADDADGRRSICGHLRHLRLLGFCP